MHLYRCVVVDRVLRWSGPCYVTLAYNSQQGAETHTLILMMPIRYLAKAGAPLDNFGGGTAI